jgi:hypothetical protein
VRWLILAVLHGCYAPSLPGDLDAPAPQDAAPDACPLGARCSDDDPCLRCDGQGNCLPVERGGCTTLSCAGSTSCYLNCPTERSWEDARTDCENLPVPGCLVTVDDAAENACLDAAFSVGFSWIGYFQPPDTEEPGEGWEWLCGATLFTHWSPPEPTQTNGEEDCAAIYSTFLAGEWADLPCDSENRYFCEIP